MLQGVDLGDFFKSMQSPEYRIIEKGISAFLIEPIWKKAASASLNPKKGSPQTRKDPAKGSKKDQLRSRQAKNPPASRSSKAAQASKEGKEDLVAPLGKTTRAPEAAVGQNAPAAGGAVQSFKRQS